MAGLAPRIGPGAVDDGGAVGVDDGGALEEADGSEGDVVGWASNCPFH